MADDSARQARALAEFESVTGHGGDKARFFLESSAWDVESAVEHFYEEDGMMPGEAQPAVVTPSVPASDSTPAAGFGGGAAAGPWPSGRAPVAGNQGAIRGFKDLNKGGSAGKRPSAGNVRSLSDLASGGGRDESDSDEDDPLEYYTGGEKSGMMVQDPQGPRGARGGVDVQKLFDTARSMGARDESPEEYEAMRRGKSSQAAKGGVFTGTARLLSGEPAQPREAAGPAEATPAAPSPAEHVITFWANGFTVNEGPLRTTDDPRNTAFLNCIQRGEYPPELVPTDPSQQVSVRLVRRTEEKYKAPEPPKYVPFSGAGRTTGSASSSASQPAAATLKPAGSTASRPPPTPCDDSAPKTSIQLRLHDGTRMVAQFNLSQTVGDIRRFIEHSQAAGSPMGFQLTTQFPTRVLTDNAQTIEEAGLLNAVVIQKA
eukprot:jgi/Mesvir1/18380/Mv14263-RA.1